MSQPLHPPWFFLITFRGERKLRSSPFCKCVYRMVCVIFITSLKFTLMKQVQLTRGAHVPSFYTLAPNIFHIRVDILLHTEICIISPELSKKYKLKTKFIGHSRIESLVRNLLNVTILSPRTWKWLLYFWKIFYSWTPQSVHISRLPFFFVFSFFPPPPPSF